MFTSYTHVGEYTLDVMTRHFGLEATVLAISVAGMLILLHSTISQALHLPF